VIALGILALLAVDDLRLILSKVVDSAIVSSHAT